MISQKAAVNRQAAVPISTDDAATRHIIGITPFGTSRSKAKRTLGHIA